LCERAAPATPDFLSKCLFHAKCYINKFPARLYIPSLWQRVQHNLASRLKCNYKLCYALYLLREFLTQWDTGMRSGL
jgi:hypothetical protein